MDFCLLISGDYGELKMKMKNLGFQFDINGHVLLVFLNKKGCVHIIPHVF